MGRIVCLVVVVPILLTLGACTFPETKMEPVAPVETSSPSASKAGDPARPGEDRAKRPRPAGSSAAEDAAPSASSR